MHLGQGRHTRALIIYSPNFLNSLDAAFGPGASFGVLAHEVGHHLTAAGGLRKAFDHSWDEELRADELAGCALALAGSPPDALENALRALASVASASHPSFSQRTPKVRGGYETCTKMRLERDAKKSKGAGAFGIGAALAGDTGKGSCWGYFYRSVAEVEKVGPIAAERKRSESFVSKKTCEAARKEAKRSLMTEACSCAR